MTHLMEMVIAAQHCLVNRGQTGVAISDTCPGSLPTPSACLHTGKPARDRDCLGSVRSIQAYAAGGHGTCGSPQVRRDSFCKMPPRATQTTRSSMPHSLETRLGAQEIQNGHDNSRLRNTIQRARYRKTG